MNTQTPASNVPAASAVIAKDGVAPIEKKSEQDQGKTEKVEPAVATKS
jgi:hypothetical protein